MSPGRLGRGRDIPYLAHTPSTAATPWECPLQRVALGSPSGPKSDNSGSRLSAKSKLGETWQWLGVRSAVAFRLGFQLSESHAALALLEVRDVVRWDTDSS